jgi:hypothetical protein
VNRARGGRPEADDALHRLAEMHAGLAVLPTHDLGDGLAVVT